MEILKRLKRFLFGSSRSSKKRKPKTHKKRPVKSVRTKRPKQGRSHKKRAASSRKIKASPKGKTVKTRPAKPVKEKTAIKPILLGEITHYFPQAKAGVVKVGKMNIKVGDPIWIRGETTNFKQMVKSMQINRIPIDEAKPGEEIGIEVKSRVRAGDQVYKGSAA